MPKDRDPLTIAGAGRITPARTVVKLQHCKSNRLNNNGEGDRHLKVPVPLGPLE